jgi:hypothetical protein
MIIFSSLVATGQQTGGNISGEVVDPSGAMIPGVNVTLSGPEKRVIRSDQSGMFSIRDLKPGAYLFRLESPGFRFPARDLVIMSGVNKSLHLVMQLRKIACDGQWMPAELDRWRSDDGSTRLVGEIMNRIAAIPVRLKETRTERVVAETTTDERGEFKFSKVVPGTYKLEIAWKGSAWVGAERLSLREGLVTQAYMGWGTADCILGR